MKSRIIHTKIWTDAWFHDLAVDEKMFFLYLLTNEYCNVLDIYELPISVAVYQTGLTKERIQEIKQTLKDAKKIDYINDYILLSNAYKYQFYKGAKNNYAKLRIIFEMNDEVIQHFHTPIGITLSAIIRECHDFQVKDENLINLLSRVIDRLSPLNITLSAYPLGYTPKKSEIRNHKSEIIKTETQNTEREQGFVSGIQLMRESLNAKGLIS